MFNLDNIKKLREDIHQGQHLIEVDELFHEIMREAFNTLICEREVAHYFSMSKPSIQRWKNGRNAPHTAVRKTVYNFLIKLIDNRIEIINYLEKYKNNTRFL